MLHKPSQQGFTLLEVLLAITLLGLIMSLAYGGLRSITRSTDRADRLIQAQTHLRAAHQFMHRQFATALPIAYLSEDDEDRFVFEGGDDFIQYVAPMPGYLGAGGPQVQQISLERGRDGFQLVFRHVPLLAYEDGILDDVDPFVLLRQIDSGEFTFMSQDEEGRLTDWESDWEETAELPMAVRLEMDMEEESLVEWPALQVSMRIDGTAGRLRRGSRQGTSQLGSVLRAREGGNR